MNKIGQWDGPGPLAGRQADNEDFPDEQKVLLCISVNMGHVIEHTVAIYGDGGSILVSLGEVGATQRNWRFQRARATNPKGFDQAYQAAIVFKILR